MHCDRSQIGVKSGCFMHWKSIPCKHTWAMHVVEQWQGLFETANLSWVTALHNYHCYQFQQLCYIRLENHIQSPYRSPLSRTCEEEWKLQIEPCYSSNGGHRCSERATHAHRLLRVHPDGAACIGGCGPLFTFILIPPAQKAPSKGKGKVPLHTSGKWGCAREYGQNVHTATPLQQLASHHQ